MKQNAITLRRILALLLAAMMLLPLISIPSFAAEDVYYSNDFSGEGTNVIDGYTMDGFTAGDLSIEGGHLTLPLTKAADRRIFFPNLAVASSNVISFAMDYTFSADADDTDYIYIRTDSKHTDAVAFTMAPIVDTVVKKAAISSGRFLNFVELFPTGAKYFDGNKNAWIDGKGTVPNAKGTENHVEVVADLDRGIYRVYLNGTLDYEGLLYSQTWLNGWCYPYARDINLRENVMTVGARAASDDTAGSAQVDNIVMQNTEWVEHSEPVTYYSAADVSTAATWGSNRWFLKHDEIISPIVSIKTDFTFTENATDAHYFDIRTDMRDNKNHIIGEHGFTIDPANGTSNGRFLNLARVYPTGVNYNGENKADMGDDGSHTLLPGQTYTIEIVIDMRNGTFVSYINGEVDYTATTIDNQYRTLPNGTWGHVTNAKDIIILPNSLTLCPANADAASYSSFANVSVIGESGVVDRVTFEGMTPNTKLPMNVTTEGVGKSQVPNAWILSGEENTFLRLPFVGTCQNKDKADATAQENWSTYQPASNHDRSIFFVHRAYKDTIYTMDFDLYRNVYAKEGEVDITYRRGLEFGVRMDYTNADKEAKTDQQCILGSVNLATGNVDGAGTVVEGTGLKEGQWNHIQVVYNLITNRYRVYVNGVLHCEAKDAMLAGSDLMIRENGSYLKLNNPGNWAGSISYNVTDPAKIEELATTGFEGINSFDLDNVETGTTNQVSYTLNGESKTGKLGESVSLNREDASLLYATITTAAGTRFVDGTAFTLEDDLSVTAKYVDLKTISSSVRLGTPLGIRYVSAINAADFDALAEDTNIKSYKLGTMIAPTLSVDAVPAFTKAYLKAHEYVEVAATPGQWYEGETVEGAYVFAGSLVNIKTENYNRSFSGVGYLEVTLADDTVVTLYGTAEKRAIYDGSIAKMSKQLITDSSATLNSGELAALKTFADAYLADADLNAARKEALTGLNVLAIGDSLFAGVWGEKDCNGSKIWVNLLGSQLSWNVTNLGIGGATMSFTQNANANENRVSIYNRLFNDPQYCWGSTGNTGVGNAYYSVGTPTTAPADVDIILLEGGPNDYGWMVPFGSADSEDPGTFLGAWNLVIDKLLEVYPNATVVMVTPWRHDQQGSRTDGVSWRAFVDGINSVYAENYKDNDRVYFLDAGDPLVSGVNMDNDSYMTQYAYDCWHLNANGMRIVASKLMPYLWNINEMR